MKIDDAKVRETSDALKKPTDFSNRTSAFTDQHRTEITYLSVQQLVPYRNQARVIFDQTEIDSLADTIKEHGIRQPLTVLRIDSDVVKFEVVSGERRLRAAKQLGLLKVPCIIIVDEARAEEIALIENVQRQDLHPVELARTLKKLMDKIGYGAQSELKVKVGLSQPQISELVKLVSLPQSVQDEMLACGYRGRDNFRRLFSLKTEEDQLMLVRSLSQEKVGLGVADKKEILRGDVKSLLRFTLADEGIRVQKGKLPSLPLYRREELKQILLDLIIEIDSI